MNVAIGVLVGLAVLAGWLAALGLWRLRDSFDRLHLVAFANAGIGLPLLVAGVLADGASARTAKLAAILLLNLAGGAAASHALGRALLQRGDR